MIDSWTTAGMEVIILHGLYANKGAGLGVAVLNGVPGPEEEKTKEKRRFGLRHSKLIAAVIALLPLQSTRIYRSSLIDRYE